MARASSKKASTLRSQARRERAAHVLSPITLDAEQAAALERGVAATGMTIAAYVRSIILQAAPDGACTASPKMQK